MKLGISSVALIGAISTAVFSVDGRYARSGELKDGLNAIRWDLNRAFNRSEKRAIESEKRALQREQFDLVGVQLKRVLTVLEMQRLKAVTEQIGELEAEAKMVGEQEKEATKAN